MPVRDVMAGGNDGVTSPGTSMTLTIPNTAQAGDVGLIHAMTSFPASATLTTPTGWTVLSGMNQATAGHGTWLLGRVLTSDDAGATVTLTFAASSRLIGVGVVLSGADSNNPFGTPVWRSNGGATLTLGTVTTTVDGSDVIETITWGGSLHSTGDLLPGTVDDTNNTAFTSGNQYSAQAAHLAPGVAGNYGGGTFSPASSSANAAYVIGINPSVASPATGVYRLDGTHGSPVLTPVALTGLGV